MKTLITGTTLGIGNALALKFLNEGHQVIGFDILPASINHPNYIHYVIDVTKNETFPDISGVEILINNAGVETNTEQDIYVNLLGTIYITEKYGFQKAIKSIINLASASARTGSEFPFYTASKGGVVSYSKNVALRLAEFKATCNSVSLGGVNTSSNNHILNNPLKHQQVLDEALLHKWMDLEEIQEFVYFLATKNKSMTGEDLFIDNGEQLKANFIW